MAVERPNRLAREKSPYLLQHARNPVDWFAWGGQAFERARVEDKPIFLSIGYSTCHWCHVMERESFEDETVARFLNDHFVSIKVDREERPDVDKIYMTFVQATTGGGGWPMSVFLTPDLKPFFGGTYFAPDGRHDRPGFLQLLRQIAGLWQEHRGELIDSAAEIHARLAAAADGSTMSNLPLTADVLRHAAAVFKAAYDARHGGFGTAPKFPQPSVPLFLLRCAARFHDEEAVRMVLHTCERMAAGGIHDQLGGGFARYAVDAEWLVPHFEKMLYDNAQLVQLYLYAHLISEGRVARVPDTRDSLGLAELVPPKETHFAAVARDILDYVLRDMTHPDGGFYSAEDADSEGHEGKFYCWTKDELAKLLTAEEFKVATRCFGITGNGNFVDHSHPHPLPGQNVLSIVNPNDETLFASAKQKMFDARSRRVRPHLDDKILASWNGLMLGAMARAYAVLGGEKYRVAAEKNLAFIREKLWDEKSKTLFQRWRDGERDRVPLLEGCAFLLAGVIELYEATLAPKHLDFAMALAEAMIMKFYDAENGGFWQSAADAKDLIFRVKDDYDGAEPSGNSMATLALLKLAAITGRQDLRSPAEATLRLFAHRLQNFPQAVSFLLQAVDFWIEEPRRVVIAGDANSALLQELLHTAHLVYQPNKIILGNSGAVEEFARTLPARDSAVAYLCTGNACQPPTNRPEELRLLLR
ncbi:MAG: thioredoxin domain-containing protein [Limisphaerales bacterium]